MRRDQIFERRTDAKNLEELTGEAGTVPFAIGVFFSDEKTRVSLCAILFLSIFLKP